ncbi:MAG: SAM-dependent chlorinase/fluorinase [Chloroflexaceae bacterium]|nr:SAM-dependent chlorinase/fluorinase [Chloroflexaceae bacterium]
MVITFLTDFGYADAYVGAMKGVALGICPGATLIDITHAVPPQDVLAGALLLPAYVPFYPPGSVHVAVVDPGVGSERRGVALEVWLGGARQLLVGPDNGIFWPVLVEAEDFRAVSLTEARYWRPQVAPTFHGRDVFTPVAARLAAGLPLEALGPPISDLTRLEPPPVQREADALLGEILTIDHFGNCASNIRAGDLAGLGEVSRLRVVVAGRDLGPPRRTFADVGVGVALALINSAGYLEVAVRDGRADVALGLRRGAPIRVDAFSAPPDA